MQEVQARPSVGRHKEALSSSSRTVPGRRHRRALAAAATRGPGPSAQVPAFYTADAPTCGSSPTSTPAKKSSAFSSQR